MVGGTAGEAEGRVVEAVIAVGRASCCQGDQQKKNGNHVLSLYFIV